MLKKNKLTLKVSVAVIVLLLVALLMRYVPASENMLFATMMTTLFFWLPIDIISFINSDKLSMYIIL